MNQVSEKFARLEERARQELQYFGRLQQASLVAYVTATIPYLDKLLG